MRKLLIVVLVFLAALVLPVAAVAGLSSPVNPAAPDSEITSAPAFSQTETLTRSFLSGGQETVADTRTVTLNVSQTNDLQGRQEIVVSWSGAHPTDDIAPDPNSAEGQYQDYPFVLLECRGVAGGADQVTPETCWTQDAESRYQDGFAYEPYQLDQYASSPGVAVVGQPSPLPSIAQEPECQALEANAGPVRYWVPWLAADGTVYDGGVSGECGQPAEATNGLTAALPSNETYGVTALDGTGSADFDVFDSTQNATLGCSVAVACSLVAVPIMGISCDADVVPAPTPGDLAGCEATGAFPAGTRSIGNPQGSSNLTVTGSLWWSPSNWRNRIVAPLTFAPAADSCPVVSSNNVVDVYGSELMLQATSQWEPYFCLGDDRQTFTVNHVSEGEPEARNQVATGAAEAAFTSDPQALGYGKPVVNAPVALTGFTISYSIDDADGDPITTLKLTPLLLAKLLTNSYPVLEEDLANPALEGNPLNITDDPEFEALNPGIPQSGPGGFAWSELMSISESSDVMEGLTTYITDDPTARAWLNGTNSGEPPVCNSKGIYQVGATGVCPAMVVDPAYKGISLPVNQWPLLSTWDDTDYDNGSALQPCLGPSPEPFDTIVAAPLADLADVSQAMQFHRANSTTTCTVGTGNAPGSLSASGVQPPGTYFMLGITPLADDYRYDLQAAELQTTPGTFVAPTDASLEAATNLLQPDSKTGTWPIPYKDFETSAGAAAYPGTMVVYAAIPTEGLPAADATDYASLLTFAAGPGQTSGDGVGQLPPGYLPLTSTDGLGALAAYALSAVPDVAAQNGQVPPLIPSPSPSPTPSPNTTVPSSTIPSVGTGQSPDETPPAAGPGQTKVLAPGSDATAKASTAATPLVDLPAMRNAGLWTRDLPMWIFLVLGPIFAVAVFAIFIRGRRVRRW